MRLFVFAVALLLCAPAYAHVTANPDNGVAGKYFETKFRISHGCDGSDTIAVTVRLPQGFVSVKPQPKAGWQIEIKKRKLDKPVPAGHGKMADQEFEEITWKGGKLSDAHYDNFGLLFKLPENTDTLWFPVKQICEKGELNWAEIPTGEQKWHDLESPAPFVKVTPAQPAETHHH